MRLTLTLLACILMAVEPAAAQKSVREYTSSQRAALQEFIEKNPEYQFIPESWFDEETLKAARNEWGFGKNFRPYYRAGDFNRDGLPDFAVILLTGKNADDPKWGMHAVVFNGTKKSAYRVAHIEHDEFSTALFLDVQHRTLLVGIMETDSAGCFIPAGRGYIVEPCNG